MWFDGVGMKGSASENGIVENRENGRLLSVKTTGEWAKANHSHAHVPFPSLSLSLSLSHALVYTHGSCEQ